MELRDERSVPPRNEDQKLAHGDERDDDDQGHHTIRLASCGSSGARPACPLKPASQWVGYDGYPSHGSPRTCTGGCPAHIHVSWVFGCYGSSALVKPCSWVMAFPAPADPSGSSEPT